MYADGEVVHDPQRHPGPHGLGLCRRELLVELPLQPAVEIDRILIVLDEPGHALTRGVLQRFRPPMPVAAVLLGQRAPGGEVVEGAAFPGPEGGIGQLAARRPRHPV